MVQPEWERLLEESTHMVSRTWYSLLHLGVMRLERFDRPGARAAWLESLQLKPSAWALRNLAALCLQEKDSPRALEYYRQAWELASQMDPPPAALAVEYLQQLAAAENFERCRQVYESLPDTVRDTDRVQLLRAQFSLALGDLDAVEAVLQRDFAVVREGEIVLTDLWFELQARREAARSGRALDAALREQVRQLYPPPARIDFRSINE
jgi:tetratricopeptide (TPR) repeat protein